MKNLTIFILLFFLFSVSKAGDNYDKLDSLLEVISAKHTKLKGEFSDKTAESINELRYSRASDEAKKYVSQKALSHLQLLNKIFNYEIHEGHEKNALIWMSEISHVALKDTVLIRKYIESNMPEVYYAAHIFLNEYLSPSFRKKLAALYPEEMLYQLQYMNGISVKNLAEAEVIAKIIPNETKKFFHYTNNINSTLSKSSDDTIKIIYELFRLYRFSGLGFPFLNELAHGKMTFDQVENICQDNILSMNKLIGILYQEKPLAVKDVLNRLSDLTLPFVKKLRYQRFVPIDKMDIGKIDELNIAVLWNILVENYNLLESRDLSNYLKLIKPRFEKEKLTIEDLIIYSPNKYFALLEKTNEDKELQQLFAHLWLHATDKMLADVASNERNMKQWESWRNNGMDKKNSGGIQTLKVPGPLVQERETIEKFFFAPYNFQLTLQEKEFIRARRDLFVFKEKFDSIFNHPLEKELIFLLAEKEPHLVLKNYDIIYKKDYSQKLLEFIAKKAPLTVKNYITAPPNLVQHLLRESKSDTIKVLFAINDSLGNASRAYLLLDPIVHKKLSLKKADEIAQNKTTLLSALSEMVISKKAVLGEISAKQELSYQALDFVRNLVISENNQIDYRESLLNKDARTLYLFLIFSEREIIKSVYNKMMSALQSKIGQNSFIDFIEKDMNGYGLSTFYRMMAFYNRTEAFADFSTKRQKTLGLLFNVLDKKSKEDILAFIDLGEIIVHTNQASLLADMEKMIREKYDEAVKKTNNAHEVAVYGMLASLLGNKVKMGWAKQAATHYNVSNSQGLSGYELFDKELISVQQYFFYNDNDGKASYRNFIGLYAQSAFNWEIKDKGDFVIIESLNGRKVVIVANKPEKDEAGIKSVGHYLQKENLHPQVVVHRGLSTHVLKTFNRIPSSAKIILDGSCGGFQVQHVALALAPSAQILCNRNVGTMHLNDPLFKQISEEIRMGNDIEWETFWDKMEAKLGNNKYFSDYIPPHKNVSSTILKKYYELLKIDLP